MPTQERLRSLLRYEPETGRFFWVSPTKYHPRLQNSEAGHSMPDAKKKKYWVIKVGGVAYKRSRLAFVWMTGSVPEQVDHVNGDSLDDRWTNLRAATALENSWNHKGRAKTTGLPFGVSLTAAGRYRARICREGVTQYLGVFETAEDAHVVYMAARQEVFGEWA